MRAPLPHIPGLPNPLSASAANRTSGSSILTLVSRILDVSMGLPTSSRGRLSGTLGNVVPFGAGKTPQCDASKFVRGLYSMEVCGV